jgi:hypothetical protein
LYIFTLKKIKRRGALTITLEKRDTKSRWAFVAGILTFAVIMTLPGSGSFIEGENSNYYDGADDSWHPISDSMNYEYLFGTETNLAAGWYYAVGDLEYSDDITLDGDVCIILANYAVLNLGGHNGIILNGNTLSLFPQTTDVTMMGKLTTSVSGTVIYGEGTLLNGSLIATENNSCPVILTSSSSRVVNYSHGVIDGGSFGIRLIEGGTIDNKAGAVIRGANNAICLNNGGIITNYGSIESKGNNGINSNGGVPTINNYGSIEGVNGITLSKGGTVNNFGAIVGNSNYGIVSYDKTTINNKTDATISGINNGLCLNGNGHLVNNDGRMSSLGNTCIITTGVAEINNSGTLKGVNGINLSKGGTINNTGNINGSSYGIIASVASVITNEANAVIYGTFTSINLSGSGDIVNNYGWMESEGAGLYSFGNATVMNNYGTVVSSMGGVYLCKGGTINNYGTLICTSETGKSVYSAGASVKLLNSGTIQGDVTLGNFDNKVTLAAGSVIRGNFTMGTGALSTLDFIGDVSSSVFSKTYAWVQGDFNLGNVTIKFGSSWPDAHIGEEIILILVEGKMYGTINVSTCTVNYNILTIEGEGHALVAIQQ